MHVNIIVAERPFWFGGRLAHEASESSFNLGFKVESPRVEASQKSDQTLSLAHYTTPTRA